MAKITRLKARLLREAVEDNVATMNGRLPKPLHRGRRLAALWGPRSTAVLFFLAAIGAVRLALGTGTADVRANAGPEASTGAARPAAVTARFPRPPRLTVAALALGIRRIVIDPGHGGKSIGTTAASGLREKDVTLDIAGRLQARLAHEGVTVVMTRAGDDTISLQERSEFANQGHGDLFLSIHLNALTPEDRGIETYYLGPSDAPAADAIAADENRDSGYSLADLRALVDMIYTDARRDESRRFAESVQHALVRDLRRVKRVVDDRGVKTAPFVVLVGTRMPAILAEVSCLSNEEEAMLLNAQGYRQSIADALFDGIQAYVREGAANGGKDYGSY